MLVALTLTVTAACDDGASPPDGSTALQVQGVVDSCPIIKSVMVSPSAAALGASVLARVVATDRDLADVLRFSWSAPSGAFANTTAASTTYQCAVSGPQPLTALVSDGRCDNKITIMVWCGTDARD
ncbi:MAG: hypothetical protein ABJA82_01555 [Myxococcales bacterium]